NNPKRSSDNTRPHPRALLLHNAMKPRIMRQPSTVPAVPFQRSGTRPAPFLFRNGVKIARKRCSPNLVKEILKFEFEFGLFLSKFGSVFPPFFQPNFPYI
ncbi:hypothetical protein AABB24_018340, partial [Solanum stoloniferum]